MKKVLAVLLAAAMIASASSAAYAAVQNVRLGGDIRTRAYYNRNLFSVDDTEKHEDFYIRQRSRLSVEADLTDNVWAVATVEADGLWGQEVVDQEGNWRAENDWDVGVAEAYIQLSEMFYSPWTTRIGRQYLNYGRGFLISSREWEYKFDTFRNILDFYPWTVDLFYSRLAESNLPRGMGSASASDSEDLFGVNMNFMADYWTMEGYVFGKRDSLDVADDYGYTKRAPVAVGLRFDASPVEAFDIWGEFAYQFGSYQMANPEPPEGEEPIRGMTGSESIRAFGFDLGAVYVFDVTWEPAIALAYTFASGDDGDDAADPSGKMFDPMFNYNYYGYAFSPRLSNIGIFNAQLSVLPSDAWALVLDFYYYAQQQAREMSVGNPDMDNGGVRAMTNGSDKDLGMELDLILEYDYTEDVSVQLVGAWFKPGKAYEVPGNNNSPDDVFELRAELRISF